MQISIRASSSGGDIKLELQNASQKVKTQIISRGIRAANALRNSALNVLNNPSPSAPGNPPGARTHNLRRNWSMAVEGGESGSGVSIRPTIYSGVHYAGYLENGTSKMAARPFRDKVAQTAMPEVKAIYSEPYL